MQRRPTRPDPRALALENAAFLRALRRSGNTDMAARAIGRARTTMQRRRKRMPEFATEWTAALVVAAARLHGGIAHPEPRLVEDAPLGAHRTVGGEPTITRTRGGRLQQQVSPRGRLTQRCEQAFLLALSATANVRLSAAAAGSTPGTFYRHRRRDQAFAREWREALEQGYMRVQLRCLAAADPESYEHDAWRHNQPPDMLPLTFDQMFQLLSLHQKEARLLAEPDYLKRRRGESREACSLRLTAMYELRQQRSREQFRVAEAVRAARGEPTDFEWEQIVLPDLAQVAETLAGPAKQNDAGAVLFGGLRIKDLAAHRKRGGGE